VVYFIVLCIVLLSFGSKSFSDHETEWRRFRIGRGEAVVVYFIILCIALKDTITSIDYV